VTIIPAGARLSIVDVPADEPTGLILPPGVEDFDKGIVVEVGCDVQLGLETGDLVYYHSGHYVKIADIKIIGADCVVAYDNSGRSS
jgi:hypothetical protein